MSDSSSEEEDFSKFREAVDNSFNKISNGSSEEVVKQEEKKSERHLEVSGHYNDVKVPAEMQRKIGAKLSAVIQRNIEFVDVDTVVKKRKIKGGVKLFKDSDELLSCEEQKDVYTENHNAEARKFKNRNKDCNITQEEKVNMVAVSGDYILSKEETKLWKSRRKEKIFKYKSNGKSKVLLAVD